MIYIRMIEPMSASIAFYLISKGTVSIKRDNRLLNKNPFYIKKKICKLLTKNREELVNSILDETNDLFMESFNYIHIKYFNPSIFVMIYLMLFVIALIV
jgi:hypothetical protein